MKCSECGSENLMAHYDAEEPPDENGNIVGDLVGIECINCGAIQ